MLSRLQPENAPALRQLPAVQIADIDETISPLPTPENLASMPVSRQIAYINALLRSDEMTALEVLTPVFRQARTFASVFQTYKPIVLLLHEHFCRPGRKEAGQITWSQVVRIQFGVSVRRMQQLLAVPRDGSGDDPERKTRKEEQVDQILIPAMRMAHGILALREHCAEDPTGNLRSAALRALAFELLNAVRRSPVPIRVIPTRSK